MRNRRGRYVTVIRSLVFMAMLLPASVQANFMLRMQTDLGAVDVVLFDTVAPNTFNNFMGYVSNGDYDGTLIQRAAEYTNPDPLTQLFPAGTPFVIQTGGFYLDPSQAIFNGGLQVIPDITATLPLLSERNLLNTRGTLAMALSGNPADPDSASNQWFVNLSDNTGLDADFTVFGEIEPNDMGVIDDIHAVGQVQKCYQISPGCPLNISPLAEMPVVLDPDAPTQINQDTIIEIQAIGVDNDGDGAVDSLEQGSSGAQHVVSYKNEAGNTVDITAPVANPFQDFNIVGTTFGLLNIPESTLPNVFISERAFESGFAGYKVTGVAPGGSIDVVITLPLGAQPNTFYNYGPEPGNTTPHWYEFSFDGTTGAMYNTPGPDQVTLRFMDGARGDDDNNSSNGIIAAALGGALNSLTDFDGVDDAIEDAGPNNGDANFDGQLDSLQGNVVTLPATLPDPPDVGGNYVTLEAALPLSFNQVVAVNQIPGVVDIDLLNNHNFRNGFFQASMYNVTPGGNAQFTITLPTGDTADTYFMFGSEPGNTTPHWYEFMFDGATGAVISGNQITLHFVDGQRGDSDLDATNGLVMELGGPALVISSTAGAPGSGGGCSLHGDKTSPAQAGAWWLLVALLALLGIQRQVYRRVDL
ncbi:MAG: peptidylprolyl isomerase [Gammaproteobacteria bacterium]|nr:peptidylprolyl isomerase [Gammaproteobacteria bacterium]